VDPLKRAYNAFFGDKNAVIRESLWPEKSDITFRAPAGGCSLYGPFRRRKGGYRP